MAEKPIVRSFQDMPPPGGYPRIATRRDARPRGPSGFAIWGGVFLMSAFGFWSLSNTSRKHRLGHAENRDARMAIIPFLRAEDDVKLAQSINQLRAKEAAVMKGTDFDIDESVYTKRKVPPQL